MNKWPFDSMHNGYNRFQVDDKVASMDHELTMLSREIDKYRELLDSMTKQLDESNDRHILLSEDLIFEDVSGMKSPSQLVEKRLSTHKDETNQLFKRKADREINDYRVTHINKTMKVNGDILCEDEMNIEGNIKGNITCSKFIHLNGEVVGNIHCESAYMDNARLIGNIVCSKNLKMSSNSEINGEVCVGNLVSSGKISGDIEVVNTMILDETAVVLGNVSTKNLDLSRGAKIKGIIDIRD